jgi:large subunit ribosomal protein L24
MKPKLKIKKGDVVKVIAGSSKGKQGKVLEVLPEKSKVLVEGVNVISKHTKPNTTHPQGGIVKKEAPIHISNVMMLDSKGVPTRVGISRKEDGSFVRVARNNKSNKEVIK